MEMKIKGSVKVRKYPKKIDQVFKEMPADLAFVYIEILLFYIIQ